MRILPYVFLLLMGMSWRCVQSTCVLETDFGLSINCGLRKSGMFRVRNLGGLKGYVGLGIQLADELGFKDSLSAVEQNKRRSVNGFPAPGSFEPLAVPSETSQTAPNQVMQNADRSAYAKMNGKNRQAIPPFRPLVSAANNMVRNVRLAQQQQQLHQQQLQQQQLQQQQLQQQQLQQQQLQQQQPLLKPLPVPAFAALPESIAKVTVAPSTVPPPPPPPLPPQQRQPQSFSKLIPQVQQLAPLYKPFTMQGASNRRYTAFTRSPANSIESRPMPIVVVPMGGMAGAMPYTKAELPAPLSNDVDPAAMASLFNVAAANNVSADQLALALRYQQQRVAYAQVLPASTTTVSTTTTTTPMPLTTAAAAAAVSFDESPVTKKISMKPYKSKYSTGGQKVMNAPKEYYPVSYDKNFDDNFTSKVDLPDTSFSCGEQKHFPGLYSDEDLGCMVFHVCAFTDEGLTQKSFLCPESTLFDQTILKCNWWFYVDCKSSRKLYDSNIPISKSYQLMKALTFFSSYNTGPLTDDKHNSTSESTSGATSVSPPAPQVNITGILEDVSTSRR